MMIMPSHLKKMVRARMEKTGESYQQAFGHVRARAEPSGKSTTSLRSIVERIIRLARKRNENRIPLNQQLVVNIADVSDHLREPLSCEARLESTLDGMPDDVLWKIEALYYAVRDGYGILEALREVPKDDHDLTVANLMEKMPLAELLAEGLRVGDEDGFDFDADW
jgi:hypothetical protein